MQGEADEATAEARETEEKAKRFMMDAAKLADELRSEQENAQILEKEKIVDDDARQRLVNEIAILHRVQHPNLLQLLEVIDEPDRIYLVTEFVGGGELFSYIVQRGRLEEAEPLKWSSVMPWQWPRLQAEASQNDPRWSTGVPGTAVKHQGMCSSPQVHLGGRAAFRPFVEIAQFARAVGRGLRKSQS